MTKNEKQSTLVHWIAGGLIPLLIVAVSFGIFMAMGTSQPKEIAEEPNGLEAIINRMPIVSTAPIIAYQGDRSLDIDVTGTVVPFRQITVASEVAGRVKYKSDRCRVGRFVEAGEVLFRLDDTDYRLEVERLGALRDSEYAQQRELDQDIANSQRSLELAEQDVSLNEREIARLETLPAGFASATELDQAKRARLTSQNQRLIIQNQLDSYQARRTRLELAERLAATQLQQAQVNLARTEVRAPISGVIVSDSAEADSYVQRGDTLIVIEDTEKVEVAASLRADQLIFILDQTKSDENQSNATPTGLSAVYELPKTPVTVSYQVVGREDTVYEWDGFLNRYEGIGLDNQSRTIPVRITVENPRIFRRNGLEISGDLQGAPPALVRGMFVNAKIHTRPNRQLVLIPKLALRPGGVLWYFSANPSESNDEWTTGNIQVVENIRVVRLVSQTELKVSDQKSTSLANKSRGSLPANDFWVAEASEKLMPGGLTVTSPLANLLGDGSDRARFQNLTPNASNGQ